MSSQATVPRRYRERGKSAGQPMRSHTLTSRSLPLIYINTSVIRVFCPTVLDKQTASGQSLARTHVLHMATLCRATIGANYVTQAAVWRLQVYLKVPVMVDKTERRHHISVHARLLKNIWGSEEPTTVVCSHTGYKITVWASRTCVESVCTAVMPKVFY